MAFTVLGLTITFSIIGCGNDNSGKNLGPNNDLDDLTQSKTRVVSFIDVSGDMGGLYNGKSNNGFTTDVWSVLSSLRNNYDTDSITLLYEKNPKLVDIDHFNEKMNKGDGSLFSDRNTYLPEMIKSMRQRCDDSTVAILISNMKYSPDGKSEPEKQKKLSQYKTNISNVLNSDHAVCLVSAVSDCKKCERSPYYYLIIGAPDRVSDVRNAVLKCLKENDTYVETVECNVDYGQCLKARCVEHKSVTQPDTNVLRFCNYNAKVSKTLPIKLDIKLDKYPPFLWDADSILAYLNVNTMDYAKCDITDVEVKGNTATICLNACELTEKSQTFTLKLGGFNPSLPRGTEEFYGAQAESECDKTISLESFIDAIADDRNIESTTEITITKDK